VLKGLDLFLLVHVFLALWTTAVIVYAFHTI